MANSHQKGILASLPGNTPAVCLLNYHVSRGWKIPFPAKHFNRYQNDTPQNPQKTDKQLIKQANTIQKREAETILMSALCASCDQFLFSFLFLWGHTYQWKSQSNTSLLQCKPLHFWVKAALTDTPVRPGTVWTNLQHELFCLTKVRVTFG